MTTTALTFVLVLLAAMPARAQDAPLGDARWAPWLGCWRLTQDDQGARAAASTSPDDVFVCVRPASAGRGVDMTTWVGDQSVVRRTVVADGISYPVREPACSGSQRSEWSLTGQRLLTRAEIMCSGQPTRIVSGITLMAVGPTWVDIQAVGTDQDAQVRIRRYQRAASTPDGAVSPADLQGPAMGATGQLAGPTSMTPEEVVDASRKIAAPEVKAALLETGSHFDLSATQTQRATVAPLQRPNGLPHNPQSFHFSPFGHSNWWGDRSHPSDSSSSRPIVVVPAGRARPSRTGPNWWGDPSHPSNASSPRSAAVVPEGRARTSGSRSNRRGTRSFGSPRPIVVIPAGPARPSSSPNWWGDRYSSTP